MNKQEVSRAVNDAVRGAVYEALSGAVHRAAYRVVNLAVFWAVDLAGGRAVRRSVPWDVYRAVEGATLEDLEHPALRDFLRDTKAPGYQGSLLNDAY